jgi:hypothetical protein
MKRIFKFIPAVLAAFAIASCSSDDFLSENKTQEQNVATKGDLRLSFDPFDNDNSTRAMRNNAGGKLTFVDGDVVNVYDAGLFAVDYYTFKSDAFYYDETTYGEKMVKADQIKYGVMPGDAVKKAYTNRENRSTYVEVEIPRVIYYNADSEKAGETEADNLYACNLPAFGYASYPAEGDYVQVSKLRYMVAVLKIKIDKAIGNASFLKLSNTGFGGTPKMLSGTFRAELFNDEGKRKETKLAVADDDLALMTTYEPSIYVDLRNVPSNTSYIYIPVVPGLDGDLDDVSLEYSNDYAVVDGTTYADVAAADDDGAISWTDTGMKFADMEFKQHKIFSGEHAFEFADMCPKLVSDILAQYAPADQDVKIDVTKSFTIDASDANVSQFIYLPQFATDARTVTINMASTLTTWKNTSKHKLIFKDADPDNPFKGTVVLNVGTTAIAGAAERIECNLAEGTLVLAGDFTKFKGAPDDNLVLKSGKVEIGDGTTTTTGLTWKTVENAVTGIKIANNATVDLSAFANSMDLSDAKNLTQKVEVNGTFTADATGIVAGPATTEIVEGSTGNVNAKITGSEATMTISIAGTLAGDIVYAAGTEDAVGKKSTVTISGDQTGAITATADVLATTVNVSGSVTGAIELPAAVWADVTISGEKSTVGGGINMPNAIKGTLTIQSGKADTPALKAVGGDVTTKGNVKVEMAYEGEAIAGTLTMTGHNKTLTLKQGYINKIVANVVNSGSWENKITKIVFASGEGLTQFNELAIAENNKVTWNKSTWNGALVTNAYKNKETKITYNGAPVSNNAVFTASQLATLGTANTEVELYNDFDLTGAGTGKDKWVGFDAQKLSSYEIVEGVAKAKVRKIENLNLQNSAAFGLINTLSGTAASVKNLEIAGVTGAKGIDASGIAAVAGKNTGTATIDNVKVTGLALAPGSGKAYTKVGGIIGNNTGAVTLKDVTVVGSIDGFCELGGFIGASSANVTINGGDATGISFKQTYDSEKKMDINYAKVGGAIGTVTSSANVTIDAASKQPSSINFDKSSKMYVSNTSAVDGNFYVYTVNNTTPQRMVGYCGNQNGWTVGDVKIGGKTFDKVNFGHTDAEWTTGTVRHYALYTWPKQN